jgi:flagellar biosynthesis/type III secretory pathway protein FliH
VDKLAKVWRNDGQEQWVLLHIEVQSDREPNFPKRVFDYYSRVRQRYNRDVASVVIFADDHPQWKPSVYESETWGCKVRLEYPVANESALMANPNPFAIVVLAQVQALRTKKDLGKQFYWKKRLIQLGYERRYTRDQIVDLFTFIDWVIVMPQELEQKLEGEMNEFEKVQHMEYMSGFERRAIERGMAKGLEQGIEKGMEKGRLQTLREGIVDILEARFQQVPYEVTEELKEINDSQRLKVLLRLTSITPSPDEFLKQLR